MQVIIVDSVVSTDDVAAIRAAVQRGVCVVASCLGQDLAQLLANPELNPLLGGTQPAADAAVQRCEAASLPGPRSNACHLPNRQLFAACRRAWRWPS